MSLEIEQHIMPLATGQIQQLLSWFVVGLHVQLEVVLRSMCSLPGACTILEMRPPELAAGR